MWPKDVFSVVISKLSLSLIISVLLYDKPFVTNSETQKSGNICFKEFSFFNNLVYKYFFVALGRQNIFMMKNYNIEIFEERAL